MGIVATLAATILLSIAGLAIAEGPIEDPPEYPELVAAYALDTGSGSVAKDAAGDHDGTIEGATWTEGKFGKALKFDGADDCVSVPNSVDLQLSQEFTLEAWVNPSAANGVHPIFFKEADDFESYSLWVGANNAGRVEGFLADEPWDYSEVQSSSQLPANTWSHVAMTSDGTTLSLFVNGNVVDSASARSAMESEGPLTIGCENVWNTHLNGKLDEPRIYARGLSPSEVTADMTTAIEPPPPITPVAAYALDTGSGSVAKDAAGDHDGTIEGATWTEGKFGKALKFDGADDCVNVPNGVDLQLGGSFTIESWVNPSSSSGVHPIFFKEADDFESYSLWVGANNAGRLEGFLADEPWEYSEVSSEQQQIPANTWTHVAMTSDGTTLRLYINATLVDSTNARNAMESEGPLTIGCEHVWNTHLNGKADEARIYNGRALSAEQIQADKEQAIQSVPQAATGIATPLSATEATLTGTVNPKGGPTTYYFEYGPTTSYGSTVPAVPKSAGSGNGNLSVEQPVSGLTAGAEYHFRVVATNEAGTSKGSDETFVMPSEPAASTDPAVGVDATEAVLTATIDPNGSGTQYRFEYGTTPAYGSTVVAEEMAVGNQAVSTEEGIGDLLPETTYHYRVVATSAAGDDAGPDRTFTTAKQAIAPPAIVDFHPDFFGVQWSARPPEAATVAGAEVEKNSGAAFLRIELLNEFLTAPPTLGWEDDVEDYDRIFLYAAQRGITILPHFGGGEIPHEVNGVRPDWKSKVQYAVDRWGAEGTFWDAHKDLAGYAPRYWEVWNEPNYIDNGYRPAPKQQGEVPKPEIKPEIYGDLLKEASDIITANNSEDKVIVGGLLSVGPTTAERMEVKEFIQKMGEKDEYHILGLHPYAFKTNNNTRPEDAAGVQQVVRKIRANIKEARDGLGSQKPIWITEIGWPTPGPGYELDDKSHLNVTEGIQRDLLRETLEMLKTSEAVALNSDRFFYYALTQESPSKIWYHHTGLRRDLADDPKAKDSQGKATKLPIWEEFQDQTDLAGEWPKPPKNKLKGNDVNPRKVTQSATLNSYGSPTKYWIKWGSGPAAADPCKETFGNFTTAESLGQVAEGDVDIQAVLAGLKPGETYHYRLVAENGFGEKTESPSECEAAEQIKTPPSTSVSADETRVLHGNPGWVWISGWAKEGDIKGPGPGLTGVNVRVNFKRDKSEPNPVISKEVPVVNGQYNTGFVPGLGRGEWIYKTVLFAQGEYDAAETDYHDFRVYDGVRIIAKHSQKCMDVAGASTANGTSIMQGSCLAPMTAQNQVFSLVPKSDGYEVVARHSGKCLDVEGAVTTDGARIMQHECFEAVHLNQEFDETWWGPSQYAYYSAKHSGKCIEVQGASLVWAPFQQAACSGGDHQLLRLEPVDSGPIPTETTFDIDQILHGTPGLVSVHGWLKAGTYSMAGRKVRIEFDDATVAGWDTSGGDLPVDVAANGSFEVRDFEVPPGYWNVRARFVGGAEFAESVSGVKANETIKKGYLAENRYSDKCLTINAGKTANGTAFIQWPCSAANGNGQVFSFRPRGGGWYDIKMNGWTRCLDIQGASTANYAFTQLYDCLGAAQYNQHWKRQPIENQPGWFALIARHSNKCASTNGWTKENGSRIVQYDCVWVSNQQWDLQGVVNP